MKRTLLLITGVLLIHTSLFAMGPRRPLVTVQFHNQTGQDLKEVELLFDAKICGFGFVPDGKYKSYLFFPHPITRTVEIRWELDGKIVVRKIPLGVEIPKRQGTLHFRALVNNSIDVAFDPN